VLTWFPASSAAAETLSLFAMQARKKQSSHPHREFERFQKCLLDLATCSQSERFGVAEEGCLEQLVLKRHVGFRLKTDAGAEDVGESTTLFGKSIDDRCASRDERSLRELLVFESQRNLESVLPSACNSKC
jgi:hypothetical protein